MTFLVMQDALQHLQELLILTASKINAIWHYSKKRTFQASLGKKIVTASIETMTPFFFRGHSHSDKTSNYLRLLTLAGMGDNPKASCNKQTLRRLGVVWYKSPFSPKQIGSWSFSCDLDNSAVMWDMANNRGRKGKERKNSTSLPDSDRGGSRVHIQDRKGRNNFRRLENWEVGKSGKWKRSERPFHHFEGFKSHRFKMGWIIMVGFNGPKAQNSSYSAILTGCQCANLHRF